MKRSASVSSSDLIGRYASARIDPSCVIVPGVTDFHARRAFLKAAVAAGAAWATADLFDVEDALAFASQQTSANVAAQTRALTPQQAEVVSVLTSRILPAVDGRPGAGQAGALYFIDRALATFNAAQRPLYTEGIADLNRRAQAKVAGTQGFPALTPVQQDEVIREIEATPFFQAVRLDTIVGTFALPSWGGNRDYMGWHLLGLEHQMTLQAPFGYYDADVNRRN
jgi:gluconate 2-dehydrogenase gamma chain